MQKNDASGKQRANKGQTKGKREVIHFQDVKCSRVEASDTQNRKKGQQSRIKNKDISKEKKNTKERKVLQIAGLLTIQA